MSVSGPGLEVAIRRRVHPGLSLDVRFRLGAGRGILFGPSGSGKTTLLRMIAGLERPDSGSIRLDGSPLFDGPKDPGPPLRSRRIGMIYQEDLLFPHLDAGRNVRFGLQRWPKGAADARLAEVAALCGIGHLLDRRPAALSGGERQRVGLARALAPRPRLLLCDEPVSALDLDARHALLDRIKAVAEAESIPVLYVTHASDEAIALGTKLFRLEGGRIVAEGPPLDVLAASGSVRWTTVRNLFPAVVEGHDGAGRASTVRVVDGPSLVVAPLDDPVGTRVGLQVMADDVVLARGPIGALSARNVIPGTVERVVRHGHEAEVVVRTVGVCWVVGVVSGAVAALGLIGGSEVLMIVKARSCRVLRDDPRQPPAPGASKP